MTYEEALDLWVSSDGTCSVNCSSPVWKDSFPSLYLYSGFIASFEGWSDCRRMFTFRGLLDGTVQYDFQGSGWPPALSQTSIGQESMEFVEYVFALMLTSFHLMFALLSIRGKALASYVEIHIESNPHRNNCPFGVAQKYLGKNGIGISRKYNVELEDVRIGHKIIYFCIACTYILFLSSLRRIHSSCLHSFQCGDICIFSPQSTEKWHPSCTLGIFLARSKSHF